MALPINTASLVDSMRAQITIIDKQVDYIKRDIHNKLPVHEVPEPDLAYKTMYRDGKPVLVDLIVAKAGLLAAIANLQAGDMRR